MAIPPELSVLLQKTNPYWSTVDLKQLLKADESEVEGLLDAVKIELGGNGLMDSPLKDIPQSTRDEIFARAVEGDEEQEALVDGSRWDMGGSDDWRIPKHRIAVAVISRVLGRNAARASQPQEREADKPASRSSSAGSERDALGKVELSSQRPAERKQPMDARLAAIMVVPTYKIHGREPGPILFMARQVCNETARKKKLADIDLYRDLSFECFVDRVAALPGFDAGQHMLQYDLPLGGGRTYPDVFPLDKDNELSAVKWHHSVRSRLWSINPYLQYFVGPDPKQMPPASAQRGCGHGESTSSQPDFGSPVTK